MIVARNISKKYGKLLAVDRVSLQADPGKITVLLGPNGAGKSTTIKSIAGLLQYQGEIYVADHPNHTKEAKKAFGYVPEMPVLYDALTVDEHLTFIRKAYGTDHDDETTDALLKRFDLLDKKNTVAKELSKGMMQKLSFLCALTIKPKALLVDEPLLGLDPSSIEEMLKMFLELKENNVSVLLSTHIIDMIEHIWDEAYIMNKGKIVNFITRSDTSGKNLKQIFFESVGERL